MFLSVGGIGTSSILSRLSRCKATVRWLCGKRDGSAVFLLRLRRNLAKRKRAAPHPTRTPDVVRIAGRSSRGQSPLPRKRPSLGASLSEPAPAGDLHADVRPPGPWAPDTISGSPYSYKPGPIVFTDRLLVLRDPSRPDSVHLDGSPGRDVRPVDGGDAFWHPAVRGRSDAEGGVSAGPGSGSAERASVGSPGCPHRLDRFRCDRRSQLGSIGFGNPGPKRGCPSRR